jgi:predicted HNH restriction endonuclease
MFAVLTENDVSQWDDKTGESYQFPKRYKAILQPGTKIVYYKGKARDKVFLKERLSSSPHYFGIAVIGEVYPDERSYKGDLRASIKYYQAFENPVLAKDGEGFLEEIPKNRLSNYWYDGVRKITEDTYNLIIKKASLKTIETEELSQSQVLQEYESREEGKPSKIYTTLYERDFYLRQQAIEIHGVTCKGCGFNFEEKYGEYAKGLIHIHHKVPVSEYGGVMQVNPVSDLVPLCPNCHAVVHRKKNKTLSVVELQQLLRK